MIAGHKSSISRWASGAHIYVWSVPRKPKFVKIRLGQGCSRFTNTGSSPNTISNCRLRVVPATYYYFVMGTARWAIFTTQGNMNVSVCPCSKSDRLPSHGNETVGRHTVEHLVVRGSSADVRRWVTTESFTRNILRWGCPARPTGLHTSSVPDKNLIATVYWTRRPWFPVSPKRVASIPPFKICCMSRARVSSQPTSCGLQITGSLIVTFGIHGRCHCQWVGVCPRATEPSRMHGLEIVLERTRSTAGCPNRDFYTG